ncbi:MAG: DUF4386 family protein [Alphaproteobacteria bacterium]|nr:DUF4386 family protein [Alphaproteobacteria bacterium]MBT4710901.1 DUF4386 family protein [Alphaproteobacteria bacterium]
MEQLSRLCGVLWILVVVTVATALAITLVYDITLNPDDIEKALQRVALHPLAHVTELVFDTLSDVLLLTVAALLYVVFGRRLGPMLGSLWFVAAAILLAAHNMGNFAFTWIAGKHAAAADPAALEAVAYAVLVVAKWGVTIGSFFFVLGVAVYSAISFPSSKFIGGLGFVAVALAIPAMALPWINPNLEILGYQLYLPMLIWQISFGIWLLRANPRTHPEN